MTPAGRTRVWRKAGRTPPEREAGRPEYTTRKWRSERARYFRARGTPPMGGVFDEVTAGAAVSRA